jgi:type IV pilus assembly protein PilV
MSIQFQRWFRCATVRQHAQCGFSLVEVLIAVVVLSIGILGVAALQTRSITQSQGSLQSSQAITLANTYADMMRANASAAEQGQYEIDPSSPPTTAPSPSCSQSSATPPSCTAAQMAAWDRYTWFQLVTTTLPSGATARVLCNDNSHCATSAVQTITVFWDQARTNPSPPGYGCSGDPTKDLACATLGLQP